jgi:G3E family GTPase
LAHPARRFPLHHINPKASIIHAEWGRVEPSLILNTGLFDLAGFWWVAVDETMRPDTSEFAKYLAGIWQEPYGDRRQEIVFIGQAMNQGKLTAQLDAALLTDAEMQLGSAVWATFPDPLPVWPMPMPEEEDDRVDE